MRQSPNVGSAAVDVSTGVPEASAAPRPLPWRAYLGAGIVFVLAYLLVPGRLPKMFVYLPMALVSPVVVGLGIRRYRPANRGAWLVFLGALTLYAITDLLWYVLPVGLSKELPYPAFTDAMYLASYAGMLGALVMMIRRRTRGHLRSGLVDAALITFGVGSLLWVFAFGPTLIGSPLHTLEGLTTLAYPLVDICLFAVAARLALIPGGGWAQRLLLIGVGGQFVADFGWALLTVHGTFDYGTPVFVAWIVSSMGFGAAAMHPSMAKLAEPAPLARPGTLRRSALIAGSASLLAVTALVIRASQKPTADVIVLAILAALLILVTVGRARSGVRGIALAIGVVVILVVGAGAWQIAESRASLRRQLIREKRVVAGLAARAVEQEMARHMQVLTAVAGDPEILAGAQTGAWSGVTGELKAMRFADKDIVASALIDMRGRIRIFDTALPMPQDPSPGTPSLAEFDLRGEPLFTRALARREPSFQSFFFEDQQQIFSMVAISYAIRDAAGRPVAVLAVGYPTSSLARLPDELSTTADGHVHIYDQDGHPITTDVSGHKDSFVDHPILARALAGGSGAEEADAPGDEGTNFVGYAPVPGVGWAVLVLQDPAEATRPIAALTARLVFIGFVVIAVALLGLAGIGRLVRRLERERRQSATILDSVPSGVVIIDPDGRVTGLNPAMEQLAGVRAEEAQGRMIADVFHAVDASGAPMVASSSVLMRAVREREVVESAIEEYLVAADGRRIPVAVSASPLVDHEGTLHGGVAIVRDISSQREVDQVRDGLISTVSHELRTPLTMIRGFSELMLNRSLEPQKSREAAEQINISAERLGRLIEELLSVSRMESGRLVVRTAAVDLEPLVAEVVAGFPGEQGRISVDLQGVPVRADRDMAVQVLTNLVSNALKYSSGAVRVTTRLDGAAVRCTVSDSGIGMDGEEQVRLFEKFFRADRPEVRKAGGTGLGMYIVRNLVQLLGGQIWVSSTPGEGTSVTFTLPIAEAGPTQEAIAG